MQETLQEKQAANNLQKQFYNDILNNLNKLIENNKTPLNKHSIPSIILIPIIFPARIFVTYSMRSRNLCRTLKIFL